MSSRSREVRTDPQLENLQLDQKQQQAVVDLARLGETATADQTVELADTLITKDCYQTGVDLVWADLGYDGDSSQIDALSAIQLSRTASLLILNSYYQGQPEPSGKFHRLAQSQLAAHALLSHRQILSLDRDGLTNRAIDLYQRTFRRSGHMAAAHEFTHFHYLRLAKSNQQTLSKIRINRGREGRLAGELADENDQLFAHLRQLQKYGLKSAYIADDSQLPIVDWHVDDFRQRLSQSPEIAEDLMDDCAIIKSLARFGGFKHRLADKAPVMEKLDPNDNAWGVKYEALVRDQIREVEEDTSFHLWDDGQLYSPGGLPLNWFADQLDLRSQYQLLRARVLSLYADLVIPAYLVDRSDEIKSAERQASQANRTRTKHFQDLVVARRRLIADPDIIQLIDQAEKEERKRTRVVSRHGVVGFIRRLPAGHRASQAQRQLCFEDQGIELPETGETYVRSHLRGGNPASGPAEIAGHRARLRYVGGAVITAAKPTQG